MSKPANVFIMEVGPRDGLQMQTAVLSVQDKIGLIERLAAAGLPAIEVGSFVNPKSVPQMANSGEVFHGLPSGGAVQYHGLWLNARGLAQALENGRVMVTGKLMLTATETFSMRNTNKSIAQTLEGFPAWIDQYRAAGIETDDLHILAAFGCNFDGAVSAGRVVDLIARGEVVMRQHGARLKRICLADTMGWGNPRQTRALIGAVRERWPDLIIKLHLHDTRGMAIANAAAAIEMGVMEFDASIGGLGGCPFAGNRGAAGNICTEDLAFLCAEMGLETGIDLDLLVEAACYAEALLGSTLPGKVMKSGSLARYRSRTA
ncbi:hydroxymethylglutaryl-CoA lyase [Pollutimonas bauzanensis]|uniref:Hydroxymethylglutaryl-CoA lyase n=1 Tax=Pollutimonas bauzanensis TaxID=658167 RepID=A0A1M5Y8W6_9BURK|nr:hydroxymethylglutaryl-CoA lyase [Pollutimonas bauzanensis]SHI07953.1 hydroxymethylglutaryl-CoA lyase [Pollutimonas bauzanensis]